METKDELETCIQSIPEYQFNDPVYVDECEYGIYLWAYQLRPGLHAIATAENILDRETHEIRPAHYRIRLRPDDGVHMDQRLALRRLDLGSELSDLICKGKSAQVEISDD